MITTRVPAIALLAVLLSACMAPLQTTSSGETANAIIIETDDTPEDAYRRMSQILLSEAFTVDHSDSSIRTLSTDWKPIRGDAQRMRLNVAVFDGSSTRIQLTGTLMVASLGESRIEAVGQSGSPNERSWSEMDRVARLYPDAVVRYERR